MYYVCLFKLKVLVDLVQNSLNSNSVNKSIKTKDINVIFEGELELVHLELFNR